MDYELTPLTGEGEAREGDYLLLNDKGKPKIRQVKKVLYAGTGHEEIIINLKKNRYFITSMVLDGTSWAKDVHFIEVTNTPQQNKGGE